MATCRIDLTTANIKNLFDKAAIDADETLNNSVKYVLKSIAESVHLAEFMDFLTKISKEAQNLGLCCQVVEFDSNGAMVVVGHAPYEADARGDILKFGVNTYGDIYIWQLKVNQGTFECSKWVKQTQAILDKHGARKDGSGNNRRLSNFNLRISWLKNWLKKGAECTEKIRLDEIAVRKRKKHNELKKEAWAGRIMPLADLIRERLPGVEVGVNGYNDDGSAWYFQLYNVKYVGPYGSSHTGLFMPKDAYVGWNGNDDIEWSGMHIDQLKDVQPIKLYTLFSTLADSEGKVVRGNCRYRKIDYTISLQRRPDNAEQGAGTWDISAPPFCNGLPSSGFRRVMIPYEELGDWFNALLDYEAAAYDIAVKAAEDIKKLHETSTLNNWNYSNMGI
jgi:hypothetical protein